MSTIDRKAKSKVGAHVWTRVFLTFEKQLLALSAADLSGAEVCEHRTTILAFLFESISYDKRILAQTTLRNELLEVLDISILLKSSDKSLSSLANRFCHLLLNLQPKPYS